MWLLVIVDGGLCHFRIGKEFCKQRVTFGAEISVVLVKSVAADNHYRTWIVLANGSFAAQSAG